MAKKIRLELRGGKGEGWEERRPLLPKICYNKIVLLKFGNGMKLLSVATAKEFVALIVVVVAICYLHLT